DFVVDEATRALFEYAIEVGFLPGVTDNVGTTARQMIEDYLGISFGEGETVSSSSLYLVRGRLAPDAFSRLAATLANPLVNRVSMKTRQEYGETGMDRVVPQVNLHAIRDYFDRAGRQPTDVEIESLAQTWSEHCKHTIFASAMDDDLPKGLYKTC